MSGASGSIQVENVVASTEIDQELDLGTVANDLEASEYDLDSYPALRYRMEDPKATALVFRSGKIVCTGATTVENVTTAIQRVIAKFREMGITVTDCPDVEVQNIVSTADLGYTLKLNAIAIGLGFESIEYEPEQFPGLVYRLDEPSVVALLFGSGKLVITGGKRLADAEQALSVIDDRITEIGLSE